MQLGILYKASRCVRARVWFSTVEHWRPHMAPPAPLPTPPHTHTHTQTVYYFWFSGDLLAGCLLACLQCSWIARWLVGWLASWPSYWSTLATAVCPFALPLTSTELTPQASLLTHLDIRRLAFTRLTPASIWHLQSYSRVGMVVNQCDFVGPRGTGVSWYTGDDNANNAAAASSYETPNSSRPRCYLASPNLHNACS